MNNPIKYFKLFAKTNPDGLDVKGVKLIPKSVSTEFRLTFTIENPNDLSYSIPSLREFVHEEIYNFNNLSLGINIGDSKPKIIGDNLYISDKLKKETKKVLENITTIEIDDFNENRLIYMEISHINFKYSIFEIRISGRMEEELLLQNYVKPIRAYDSETHDEIDIDDAINVYYYNKRKNGRFHDSENYEKVDSLLDDYPTLVDSDWMVSFIETEFVL
jgi:hypothetical protein